MNLSPPPGSGSTSGSTSEGILKADWVEPAPWPAWAGANPPLLDESEADEEAPEAEDEDEEEAHPALEVANVNGVLVDLSEADQDLANNNDPNNNAANLNEPLLEGHPDLAIQPPAPTLAEAQPDPSPEEPPEHAPDESEASLASSSSHEVSFKVDLPTDNPGEGSSGCSEASESLESGSPHTTPQQCPTYEALKADALLILKFMPGKSFEEIHHYLEAHIDNPARVQVVLNEFLEEVEQKSESSSKFSKFRSSSSQPMELSASSSGTDSDSEINLVKNKSGNGLKAKNSKLNKPSSDPPPGPSGSCETKASRGVLRKSHSGRKRLISLDPNLSDEDLDFKSKIAHTNVETTTTTRDDDDPAKLCKPVGDRGVKRRWSKKSSKDGGGLLRRQHERSKIQLSEKHLHGPYNFYDHRKRGAPSSSNPSGTSSSTSDAFASSRPRGKIEFKALRKDLQVIVDSKPGKGNISNSSARSGAAMSGPSTESKNGNDSPPVVDLRDLPPSPVVVVDLSDADQSEKRGLLGSFTNMFPGTPVEYLVEQADELAGKPAAIERFIMELLARESKPPDYWVPKAQRPPEFGFSVGSNVAGPPLDPDPSLVNGDEVLFPIDGGTYPNQLPPPLDEPKEGLKMDLLDWQAPPNHLDEVLLPAHPGEPIIDLPEEVVEEEALAGPSNEENQEDKNKSRFSTVEILFPQADPEFLHQKVLEFENDDEAFNRWVNESLENKGSDFPSREAYEKRQEEADLLQKYSREVDVEDILNMYEDPVAFFSDKTRKTSELYEKQAVAQLKREFCYVGVNVIMKIFIQNNKLYYPAFKTLKKYNGSKRKTKRMDHECSMPQGIDLNFLKEVQFSRIEGKIEARKQNLEEERQLLIEEGKKSGSLIECSCCYNDECLPQDMLPCRGGHLFCIECVQRASQVAVGEAKTSLTCLGQCDEIFELSTLQKALKANMFSKWLKKISLAEIEKADIEGLERCPFCEFATIMEFSPEENKVFQCQNPECGKESCRLCKEISHIPLRCEEVEKDAEVRKRTYIENKMTEALVRKCWKCGKPYLKVDGCNKMTCTCGAKMCYLCRKPVTDYTHFYGQGGVSNGKQCPLWSDNNKLHERDVAKGALEAKKNMDEKEPSIKLKHDPTKNIREEAALENEAAAPPPHPLEVVVGGRGGRIRQHIVAQQRMIENQIEALNRMGRGAGGGPGPVRGPPGAMPYPMHVNPMPQRRQGAPHLQYNNLINQMGEILELRNQHRMREQELLGREREALEGYGHHHALVPQPPPPQPHPHNPYMGRGGPGGMGPPPAHFHNAMQPMRRMAMAPPRHVNAPQHNQPQPQPQPQPGQINPNPGANPTLMAGPVLDPQGRPRVRNDRFDEPPLMFNNYFGQMAAAVGGDPPRPPMGERGVRMMPMGRGGEQPGEQPVDLRPQPADLRRVPVIVGHPAGPPRPPPPPRDNRHGRPEGQMEPGPVVPAGAPAPPPGPVPQPPARVRAHNPPPPPHPPHPPPVPPRPNGNGFMDMYLDAEFLLDDLNPFDVLF